MKAYKSGDALEAIKCFKSSGSAESNYMLGVIYEQGCGNVAANTMMARKYFKAAAKWVVKLPKPSYNSTQLQELLIN